MVLLVIKSFSTVNRIFSYSGSSSFFGSNAGLAFIVFFIGQTLLCLYRLKKPKNTDGYEKIVCNFFCDLGKVSTFAGFKKSLMQRLIIVLFLFMFSPAMQVLAQQTERPLTAKFLVEGGIEYGGDEILQVFFTNGEDQTMRAGQGGFIAVGGELQFSNVKQLMLRTSIGIKYNNTAADNANIRLTRFPVHLTPFWKINNDFRLGVGITTHLGPSLKGDGFIDDVDYTSTAGPRFEFGYKWIALTYTAINYKDESGESFSASSIGASVSFTFPNKKKTN